MCTRLEHPNEKRKKRVSIEKTEPTSSADSSRLKTNYGRDFVRVTGFLRIIRYQLSFFNQKNQENRIFRLDYAKAIFLCIGGIQRHASVILFIADSASDSLVKAKAKKSFHAEGMPLLLATNSPLSLF